MTNTAIKVENLSKAYNLGQIGTGTLSRDLERWWANIRGKEDPFLKIGQLNDRTVKDNNHIVWSLKNINFEIEQGQAIGIIGKNGAGKSTLLKLLSQITSPTEGKIKIKGRIASLLEVGTGFHPELTGRENIFLNGAILGMRKNEIKKKFNDIVEFAGIEKYVDTPVKRYSSGMYVRLAFAVAAHLECECLIVDEVLAVGDAEFQNKCMNKMNDLSKSSNRTIIFVSHNLGLINSLCSKSLLLSNGESVFFGDTREAIEIYTNKIASLNTIYKKDKIINQTVFINRVYLLNSLLSSESNFLMGDDIFFKIELSNPGNIKDYIIGVQIVTSDGVPIYNFYNTDDSDYSYSSSETYITALRNNMLYPGMYNVSISLSDRSSHNYDYISQCLSFEIFTNREITSRKLTRNGGNVYTSPKWNAQ
ncbi:MAG: ABC transporter ATP-binding protein [Chitinophagaceae bacterium]|nr:ABC transporter ATP-binding protein [Chitinophagaceae bacterium]